MDLNIRHEITETENDLTIGDEEMEYSSTGPGSQRIRRSIATTEVEIAIDAVILAGNDPGLMRLKNLDASNYVELGIATGVYFSRIPPGQAVILFLNPAVTSIFLKANTAAVQVDGFIYER